MTLVAAIPLRGGMINLGGDGQMVIGGLVAALVPLYLPAPGPVLTIAALLAAAIAAGLYAALAAWGEARHGIPTLISSLLLSYPAVGVASYIVGFPLRDTTTGLAQTVMIPAGARLPVISGPLNAGFRDHRTDRGAGDLRRSAHGVRLRAPHARRKSRASPAMAACDSDRQSIQVMFASGAIAGLVGAIIVLGSQFRFTDGALLTPAYTWSGLMAALLAAGEPIGAICGGFFFAALQTGGFAMQRETSVPRVLTIVLQSIIILFLAIRHGMRRS